MGDEQTYDVIVVGAGLGGLLTAARFLQRGQRVLVVERLAHPGGRFTAKTFQGAQVSTGAVHMHRGITRPGGEIDPGNNSRLRHHSYLNWTVARQSAPATARIQPAEKPAGNSK